MAAKSKAVARDEVMEYMEGLIGDTLRLLTQSFNYSGNYFSRNAGNIRNSTRYRLVARLCERVLTSENLALAAEGISKEMVEDVLREMRQQFLDEGTRTNPTKKVRVKAASKSESESLGGFTVVETAKKTPAKKAPAKAAVKKAAAKPKATAKKAAAKKAPAKRAAKVKA